MFLKVRTILIWAGVAALVVGGITMLFLSFSGPKEEAPQVDMNAIYTNVASTVMAQQTLQAGTFVATPTPTLVYPTAALSPIPSPTFQQQASITLPTIKPTSGSITSLCDNSIYVSDVTIPDGTTIAAGQSFTKTWKVTNTGTCAWTATYQISFVSGDSLGGKNTAIGKVVNPGQSAEISVVLTSSSAKGTIKGTWKLSNDKGQQFGDSLTVVINSGAAKTGTATITPTGSLTYTPTKTPTTKTATPITKTATPTFTPIIIVVTATFTPTAVAPTNTPVPTVAAPTDTPIPPTDTPVPLDTPTPEPTPTITTP